MPWDRKRLLGYVETIQFILGWLINNVYKVNLQQMQFIWEVTDILLYIQPDNSKFVISINLL